MKASYIYILIGFVLMSCTSKSVALFNGADLTGWRGDQRIWSVEDESIVGKTTDEIKIDKNTFLIYETPFSNFELTLSYKIVGGNSGIQYRAEVLDENNFVVKGYQADLEAGVQYSGILYEENGRGIMALRGEQVFIDDQGVKTVDHFDKSENIQANINQDQWNTYRIVAKGHQLQHYINGKKTIEVVDNEIGKRSDSGFIALQVHAGPNMTVYFKEILIEVVR